MLKTTHGCPGSYYTYMHRQVTGGRMQ